MSKLTVDLEKVAHAINLIIPAVTILFALLGYYVSFYFHFITVIGLFLTAIGCMQALQCNKNSYLVEVSTHNPKVQIDLDIEQKALRVERYATSLHKDHKELLAPTGHKTWRELNQSNLIFPPAADTKQSA